MAEPAYVAIAGGLAKQIRSGQLHSGEQLPGHNVLAERYGVSEIVIRKAVVLLQTQGLVRTVERRGTFVAERVNLTRVSPERQAERAEESFGNESVGDVRVERDERRVRATAAQAESFGVAVGDDLTHVVTRATEDGRPISISDTYQPTDSRDMVPAFLEETLADRVPTPIHAEWLGVSAGDLAKTVHQRFLSKSEGVVMISDITYPRDRYDAFVFRMSLPTDK